MTTETNTSADTAVGADSKENTVHDDKDEPPSTASPDSTTKGPKCISLEELQSFHEDPTGPAPAVCPCDTPNGSDHTQHLTCDRIVKAYGGRRFRNYEHFC